MAGASTLAGLQSDFFLKGFSDNWLTLQKRMRSGESRKNTQQNPVPGGQVSLSNYGWEMPGILQCNIIAHTKLILNGVRV